MNMIDELIQIMGKERSSADKTVRYAYSRDASSGVIGMPDYVGQPIDTEEVVEVMTLASEHRIPVTPRGAGTGTVGGCVPLHGGIVLDMSRMNKIIDIDVGNLCTMVEPGVIGGKLNEQLAKEGFFFAPDPMSARFCTMGGIVGNCAGGSGGLKYGVTKHHVLDLEVVLPDGSAIRTGSKVAKSDSGYDLTSLFIGSEGTLGVVTKALVKILPLPETRSTVIAYFDDLEKTGEVFLRVLSKGIVPGACELMDSFCIKAVNSFMPIFQEAEVLLLFRLEGSEEAVKKEVAGVISSCRESGASEVREAATKEETERLWLGRSALGPALVRTGKTLSTSYPYCAEDYGVPPRRIPEMLKEIKKILHGKDLVYVTAGHIGDGNLHSVGAFDLSNEDERRQVIEVSKEIYRVALALEGTVTCEHGIGADKIELLKEEHKSSYPLMQTIKKAIDPANIMNPGKIFE